jgi:hypothetical protein
MSHSLISVIMFKINIHFKVFLIILSPKRDSTSQHSEESWAGVLKVWGQTGLHSKFQSNLGFLARPFLKNQKNFFQNAYVVKFSHKVKASSIKAGLYESGLFFQASLQWLPMLISGPSFLPPSLPPFFPPSLPSFLPSFPPSLLASFLPSLLPSLPPSFLSFV